MTRIHSNLHLAVLTEEQHKRTCNYWFVITCQGPHTAFSSVEGLKNWMQERGLALSQPLTEAGTHSTQFLVGSYGERAHMTPEEVFEFDHGLEPVVTTRTLSNGDYTLAKITEEDGIRVVHTLNPNVRNRTVFNYRESSNIINPGYFKA
jgi:hypothetical protein